MGPWAAGRRGHRCVPALGRAGAQRRATALVRVRGRGRPGRAARRRRRPVARARRRPRVQQAVHAEGGWRGRAAGDRAGRRQRQAPGQRLELHARVMGPENRQRRIMIHSRYISDI